MQIPTTPDLPPPVARALPMASLIDSRDCPVCGKSLKGRQRVCSGACRAKLSSQGLDPMALALKALRSLRKINYLRLRHLQSLPDRLPSI